MGWQKCVFGAVYGARDVRAVHNVCFVRIFKGSVCCCPSSKSKVFWMELKEEDKEDNCSFPSPQMFETVFFSLSFLVV